MTRDLFSDIKKRFAAASVALLVVLAIGTAGYRLIGGSGHSMLDCLYMTVITISTIGFTEVIDMSGKPYGRLFTIFIALGGVGTLTYMLSNFTAFVVEGDLDEAFRRRKMEKNIAKLKGHYIVCGSGRVGFYIVDELRITRRQCVVVDTHQEKIDHIVSAFEDVLYINGDATDNDILMKAGIMEARGVFAVTGDDNQNLVVSLSAKQLNPSVRVVARCSELRNIAKLKRAGANSIVLPDSIGGLRMASEMIRPEVVSFLDIMIRDREANYRIEEIRIPASFKEKKISALNLGKYPQALLLALKTPDEYIYNPPDDREARPGDTLIFMATPGERLKIGEALGRE